MIPSLRSFFGIMVSDGVELPFYVIQGEGVKFLEESENSCYYTHEYVSFRNSLSYNCLHDKHRVSTDNNVFVLRKREPD